MGLGGLAGVLPGISAVGTAVSIGSVCGVDRSYGFIMALLMNLGVNIGLVVLDLIAVFSAGLSGLYFALILRCLVTGVAAFAGAYLAIQLLRRFIGEHDYTVFAYYCWGLALFTFILNLMA